MACAGRVGSGASPTADLPSAGVLVHHAQRDAEQLAQWLRAAEPPVFARIQDGGVLLDMRTVSSSEQLLLQQLFENAS